MILPIGCVSCGCESGGVGDVGVLDVEAAGRGVGEETPDAPSATTEIERPPGAVNIRRDNERFATLDPPCRETQPVLRFPRHGVQLAGPGTVTGSAQERAELMQVRTDELPLGEQGVDGGRPEQAQTAPHRPNALRR